MNEASVILLFDIIYIWVSELTGALCVGLVISFILWFSKTLLEVGVAVHLLD